MKTLAVIPARLAATRLPNKPLRLLGGLPIVTRVWERVRDLAVTDDVVVATDSIEVRDALATTGARVVLTSDGHPSGTDRVAEVAGHADFQDVDVILNVQGDEPFVSAEALRGALAMVDGTRFHLGTAAAKATETVLASPDVVKVVTDDAGRAMYFSRAAIPFLRDAHHANDRAMRDTLIRQHIGVYAYTREALAAWVALPPHPLELVERLEQLRPLAAGWAMGVATVDAPPVGGIDTEDDLARANARWASMFAASTSEDRA